MQPSGGYRGAAAGDALEQAEASIVERMPRSAIAGGESVRDERAPRPRRPTGLASGAVGTGHRSAGQPAADGRLGRRGETRQGLGPLRRPIHSVRGRPWAGTSRRRRARARTARADAAARAGRSPPPGSARPSSGGVGSEEAQRQVQPIEPDPADIMGSPSGSGIADVLDDVRDLLGGGIRGKRHRDE